MELSVPTHKLVGEEVKLVCKLVLFFITISIVFSTIIIININGEEGKLVHNIVILLFINKR